MNLLHENMSYRASYSCCEEKSRRLFLFSGAFLLTMILNFFLLGTLEKLLMTMKIKIYLLGSQFWLHLGWL
jgi:hypothetical protein